MKLKVIYIFFYSVTIFFVSSFIYNNPVYNWDILPYMAISYELEGQNRNDIHNNTYNIAETRLPKKDYEALLNSDYRLKNYQNNDFFHEQLVYYRVKPLYNILVWISYKTGFSLVKSTIIPGIISLVGLAILLLIWFNYSFNFLLSSIIGLPIILSLIPTTCLSTPDMLSIFMIIAATFSYKSGHNLWAILLLFIAVFCRVDNAIYSILLGCLIFYDLKSLWYHYLIYILVIIISVWVIFNLNPDSSLSNNPPDHLISINNYIIVLIKNAYFLIRSPFTIIIGIIIIANRHYSLKSIDPIIIIVLLTLISRMIILPVSHSRFYLAYEIILIALTIIQYRSKINSLFTRYEKT